MADADGGVDGSVCMAGSLPAARAPRHRCDHLTGPPRENRARGATSSTRWSGAQRGARRDRRRARRGARRRRRDRGRAGDRQVAAARALAAAPRRAAAPCSAARASEFEADLPYALWTEALDRHLAELGERRARAGSALADCAALATGARRRPPPHHRALRDLLERLAATRPLVVCLDDVHWADPASRRRPRGARAPAAGRARCCSCWPRARAGCRALAAALAAARARPRDHVRSAPLSEAEARELVGDGRRRSTRRAAATRSTSSSSCAGGPAAARPGTDRAAAVAAALAAELGALGAGRAAAARGRGGGRRPVRARSGG